jgi:Skp family chaperone for outer membrane proteins
MKRIVLTALLMAGIAFPLAASAQGPGYFIPPQQRAPAQAHPAQPARPQPPPAAPVQMAPEAMPGPMAGQEAQPPPQFQLPPPPTIPGLPRGAMPPASIIGVIGVPEVLHASTAAQQIDKVIGERREKLNEDAQKEQATWRDMQQALTNDRAKLSPEQIRTRERELQDRITKAQRDFRERGEVVQLATQYGLTQIERALGGVIQSVAESRGMNLVLHRQNVALNVAEFDITAEVAEDLNKVLPSVIIPPDGVKPPVMPPVAQAAPPAAAQPAATAPEPAPPAAPLPAPPPAPPKK